MIIFCLVAFRGKALDRCLVISADDGLFAVQLHAHAHDFHSARVNAVRPQQWSIFQSDGMINGFFQATMFFNGFDNVGPSPLNVF